MSEPVAWVYVDSDGMKMHLSGKSPGSGYKPLYDSRVIAELVGALARLQYAYRLVAGLHNPCDEDVFTLASSEVITKYGLVENV